MKKGKGAMSKVLRVRVLPGAQKGGDNQGYWSALGRGACAAEVVAKGVEHRLKIG